MFSLNSEIFLFIFGDDSKTWFELYLLLCSLTKMLLERFYKISNCFESLLAKDFMLSKGLKVSYRERDTSLEPLLKISIRLIQSFILRIKDIVIIWNQMGFRFCYQLLRKQSVFTAKRKKQTWIFKAIFINFKFLETF